MRWVSTRVLPEPAPARISSGPSPCVTASRWGSFRPSRSWSIAMCPGPSRPRYRRSRRARRASYYNPRGDGADRRHPRRLRATSPPGATRVRIVEEAIEPYAATLPAGRRRRRTWRRAPLTSSGRRSSSRSTRSTSARAGSRRWTSRRACRDSAPSRPGCARTARGPPDELRRHRRGRRSPRALGQDPDHELMGLFATALDELGARVRDEHGGAFLRARPQRRRLRRGAGRPCWPAGRPGTTSRPTTTARCRSSSARRSPQPTWRSPASRPATTCTA